jgi:hypothetical protein
MTDFHGWEAGALREDTKFAIKHFAYIERLARSGKRSGSMVWQRSASRSQKPQSDTLIMLIQQRRGIGWASIAT